ncbi:MAG: glyoxalase [Bacteroidetes bacterium]|nr:glyoxalase [Bacteroidota bacterium]
MQIKELTLHTNSITAVKDFYGSVLSLKIISENSDIISFQSGSTQVNFKLDSESKNPFYHFAFNIPSNKIEEAKDWMKGKVDLMQISENNHIVDFVNWKAKSVYFFDPAGNIVELISRFDLDNKTSEPFDSSQILNVSEIGIVTDNVPALKEKLINDYKVSDFVKSVNSDTFSAMGDDNGLFIVAVNNRNWYPTQIPSQKFPFEVKFIIDKGELYTITDKTM